MTSYVKAQKAYNEKILRKRVEQMMLSFSDDEEEFIISILK
jgi:hypothetical protein